MADLTITQHVELQRMAHWSRAYVAAYAHFVETQPKVNYHIAAGYEASSALEQFDERFLLNQKEPGRYD